MFNFKERSEKAIQFLPSFFVKFQKTFAIIALLLSVGGAFSSYVYAFAQEKEVFQAEDVLDSNENLERYEGVDIEPSKVPIQSEDTTKRSVNEKHFRKIDGTYEVAIYSEDVHYFEGGKWKDINNDIQFDEQTKNYRNQANRFSVEFPETLTKDERITLSRDDYEVSWQIIQTNDAILDKQEVVVENQLLRNRSEDIRELSNISSSVVYRNVKPNVDLKYDIIGSTIKEYVILNQYQHAFLIQRLGCNIVEALL